MQEKILILDFGSQYTQVIARRVRELNVYCEIYPFNKIPEIDETYKGIILSGSPFSVKDKNAPSIDIFKERHNLPVLAVCYGAQLLALDCGGEVASSKIREYGRANLSKVKIDNKLLKGMSKHSEVWMSHGDTIKTIPDSFEIIAGTNEVKIAAFQIKNEEIYGVQFHPEVSHTTEGSILLKNFVVNICKTSQSWTPDLFIETKIKELKEKLGSDKVILGLSGGVDSTVAAVILQKAIGKNLYCIFINNGLLRKDEFEKVLTSYKKMNLNVKGVDASKQFLDNLVGVINPEEKRKSIGKTFIEVFDQEAKKIKDVVWLAQGTIYSDVIESKSINGPSATIKSHHNVGGLPDYMKLKVVEPLNTLFKDEVRKVGRALKISDSFIMRHPFPGPGLGIRIIGEITKERLEILRQADDIFVEGLIRDNLYSSVWQAITIFLPIKSVGVMGDERTYENVICLRAVNSTDVMTADWVHLPYEFLAKISNEIINKVKGINRVVYDISSKPPATIEWE